MGCMTHTTPLPDTDAPITIYGTPAQWDRLLDDVLNAPDPIPDEPGDRWDGLE